MDLYGVMREWISTQPQFGLDEWSGPGAYSMEIICTKCHRIVGIVKSDKYVAYKYLDSEPARNLEASEFIPADPRFFNKIKSASHNCPKNLVNTVRNWF